MKDRPENAGQIGLLYYNNIAMTHHHHPGHTHPPARVAPSFLRMSAAGRIAVALAVSVLVWGAAFWSMH